MNVVLQLKLYLVQAKDIIETLLNERKSLPHWEKTAQSIKWR